ncbi:MAG: hypothetical protein ACLFPF_08750 [Halanaerobiales bacterium]
MLLISSFITEKSKKRDSKKTRFYSNKKVEERMEDLKQNTIVDYYLNGGY